MNPLTTLTARRDYLTDLVLDAYSLCQRMEILRILSGVRPAGCLSVREVLDLFTLHGGRVPGFEFGDSLGELEARGLISKSPVHLNNGFYVTGPELAAAIKGGGE